VRFLYYTYCCIIITAGFFSYALRGIEICSICLLELSLLQTGAGGNHAGVKCDAIILVKHWRFEYCQIAMGICRDAKFGIRSSCTTVRSIGKCGGMISRISTLSSSSSSSSPLPPSSSSYSPSSCWLCLLFLGAPRRLSGWMNCRWCPCRDQRRKASPDMVASSNDENPLMIKRHQAFDRKELRTAAPTPRGGRKTACVTGSSPAEFPAQSSL
jgi:hypothetical protein